MASRVTVEVATAKDLTDAESTGDVYTPDTSSCELLVCDRAGVLDGLADLGDLSLDMMISS